jgi:hypothetical protein
MSRSSRVDSWRGAGELECLAGGGTLECDGQQFSTLEALFLHLVGERTITLIG